MKFLCFVSTSVAIHILALIHTLWRVVTWRKVKVVEEHNFLRYKFHQENSAHTTHAPTSPPREVQPDVRISLLHAPSFLLVHNRLYLALLGEKQAEIVSRNILTMNYLVVPLSVADVADISSSSSDKEIYANEEVFEPPSLGNIFKFDEMASALERKHPRMKLVFQTGPVPSTQIKMAFLMGCHMIMTHGIGFEETNLAFRNFRSLFGFESHESADITIASCWRAFCCAKSLAWIEFNKVVCDYTHDDPCIHIDEYMHYARYVQHQFSLSALFS
jgi:hypothetical protein